MDNVSQTIKIKAFTVINQNAITQDARVILAKAIAIQDVTSKDRMALLNDVDQLLSPELKAEIASLGVSCLLDDIPLELSLGDFLFEIIMSSRKAPQAPLKLALFQKQTQELATRFQSDTLTINSDDLQTIRSVLDDDVKWTKVQITASVKSAEATRDSVTLTANGVSMFGDILASAIEIFDTKVEKKKADKKVDKKKKKAKK